MSLESQSGSQQGYSGAERRSKPRIYEHFPVRVWGVDAAGRKFELEAKVENLSASGLCVYLPCEVEVGEPMMVLVHFRGAGEEGNRPRVAAHGAVIRSRKRNHRVLNKWETAVLFAGHTVI